METNLNITIQNVEVKPRKLKAKWSMDSIADFEALLYNKYEKWIAKVSHPDYIFTNMDHAIFEALMRFKAEQKRANGIKDNS